MEILTKKQQKLLSRERELLNKLQITLVKYGVQEQDQKALAESIHQLDDFFLLVVVGEFNAGKSAFINALLGEKILLEGVTPTTTKVNILRYGEEQEQSSISKNLDVLVLNSPYLKEFSSEIISLSREIESPGK